MNIALVVLVSLLVGGFALAFYMDWLGLWVSKEEKKEQIERSKERIQALEKQIANTAPKTEVKAKEETGAEVSGIRL